MTAQPIILNIDEYFDPLYGSPIIIPENYVIYRGYDTNYPTLSDRPSHYSVKSVAIAYANKPNSTLGCFKNTRALRLLDFRYLCVLLNHMFLKRKDNSFTSLDPIVRISVGYGLCDIRDQIELGEKMFRDSTGMQHLKLYYDKYIKNKNISERPIDINPISPAGFRIAETMNDGYILNFIKEIFGDIADGFIAPRLKSPYHYEKNYMMSPEIVLFSPLSTGIIQISDDNYSIHGINQVLELRSARQELQCSSGLKTHHRNAKLLSSSGGSSGSSANAGNRSENYIELENINASDEFYRLVSIKDTDTMKLLKESNKAAKKWKKEFKYINHYTIHPASSIYDWTTST
jgi:hypothetical protein